MTEVTVTALWFMAVTACCSIYALYVALSTSALCRSLRLSALSTRLLQYEERAEALEGAVKVLRSRLAMQDLRARRAGVSAATEPEPAPPVANADDKAEIRRRLNTIRPGA